MPDIAPTHEQPRLNRRQAAKIRTRGKVLDAARALFAERGYDAATIRDIAKAAGMSTGAVFANFQDKAELFETVLADEMAALLTAVQAGTPKDGPVADRLVSALSAGYHRSLDQLPLMQATIARSWFQPAEADQRARTFTQPLIDHVAGVLRDGVGAGQLRQDGDLTLLAGLVWTLFVSNFRQAAYDGLDLAQLETRLRTQIDLVLQGQRTA
ncbi:MAG TPA: TetR/AcrR family transcriptional regulator [Brevundimonas sp.]|uniref:TetR/AcrR family transcriptional regulator n=1 Tax=Brevundimonas sp. TaxID=1871086 RepID=UPI00263A3565|nr:TetR/AcrR family transcriptional regulator [Brevundimonas sp.]HRO33831.1 TetR/AcrR family transcriptional regulator [Brevundimonas sp.]